MPPRIAFTGSGAPDTRSDEAEKETAESGGLDRASEAVYFSGGGDGGVPVGLGTGRGEGRRQWVRRRALQGITEELGELKARIARMRVSPFFAVLSSSTGPEVTDVLVKGKHRDIGHGQGWCML